MAKWECGVKRCGKYAVHSKKMCSRHLKQYYPKEYKEHRLRIKAYRQKNSKKLSEQNRKRYRKKNPPRIYEKKCLVCNKKFSTKRHKVGICSGKCRKERRNKTVKKWLRKARQDITYRKNELAYQKRLKKRNPVYAERQRERSRGRLKGVRKKLPLLMKRQKYRCGICERFMSREITPDIHVDHIIPVSKGGSDKMNNLQATHAKCNLRKYNNVTVA